MSKTTVIGVGNLLLSDDGVGIHAIRKLEQVAGLPSEVELVDGGTAGLNLMSYLEGVDCLIIIDAVEMGRPPGSIVRLSGDKLPVYFAMKISPHEITLPDLLAAAKLRDLYPKEVIIWGIQPQSLAVGVELSPALAEKLEVLVEQVINEITQKQSL